MSDSRFAFFVLALLAVPVSSALAQTRTRGPAPAVEANKTNPSPRQSAGGFPLHGMSTRLASTAVYDLYQYNSFTGWCADGMAQVSLVFKVDADFVITDDDVYKQRFQNEILPVIEKQCSPLTSVQAFNYVKGVWLDAGLGEHPDEGANPPTQERALNNIDITVASGTATAFARITGSPSLAAARSRREQTQDRDQRLVAASQSLETERKLAVANLEATRVSNDGALNVGGVSTLDKALFLQIYDGNFVEMSRVRRDDYAPYLMYSGVIQGYDALCHASLPPQSAKIDIYADRYLRSEYNGFVNTQYYERYLAGSVSMDRRYEVAYRNSMNTYFAKFLDNWQRTGSDGNILGGFAASSARGIELATDSRRLISDNGCGNKAVARFMDNLTLFVTDTWTNDSDGKYQYSEEKTLHGYKRVYAKVPATFSPTFPTMTTENEIEITLDEREQRAGLQALGVDRFSRFPFMMKGREEMPPAYVLEAIRAQRYSYATCIYTLPNGAGFTAFYWNANAPLPPADVQEYSLPIIRAAAAKCPLEAPTN